MAIDVLKSQNCWHRDDVQQLIGSHCHQLSDEGRARITIGLANCHLDASGFTEIPCPLSRPIRECTLAIGKDKIAYTTYTTFYAHIDSLCFYMSHDHFTRATEDAVNSLFKAALLSKDRMEDLANEMFTKQSETREFMEQLSQEESKRFDRLIGSLSDAKLILNFISQEQGELREQTKEVQHLTSSIHAKQRAALEQLGYLSNTLNQFHHEHLEFQAQHAAAHEDAMNRLSHLSYQTYKEFQQIHSKHAQFHNDLHQHHATISKQAADIAVELTQTKHQLSSLIMTTVNSIKQLRIDFLSMTNVLFYPLFFFVIYFATSHPKTVAARVPLYVLLFVCFFLERSLTHGSLWAQYFGHSLLCVTYFVTNELLPLLFSAVFNTPYDSPLLLTMAASSPSAVSGGLQYSPDGLPHHPTSYLYSSAVRYGCFSCHLTYKAAMLVISPWISSPVVQESTTIGASAALKSLLVESTTSPLFQHLNKTSTTHAGSGTLDATAGASGLISSVFPDLLGAGNHSVPQLLVPEQYSLILESIRSLFLVVSAIIWCYTIVSYRDRILHLERNVFQLTQKQSNLSRKLDTLLLTLQTRMSKSSMSMKDFLRSLFISHVQNGPLVDGQHGMQPVLSPSSGQQSGDLDDDLLASSSRYEYRYTYDHPRYSKRASLDNDQATNRITSRVSSVLPQYYVPENDQLVLPQESNHQKGLIHRALQYVSSLVYTSNPQPNTIAVVTSYAHPVPPQHGPGTIETGSKVPLSQSAPYAHSSESERSEIISIHGLPTRQYQSQRYKSSQGAQLSNRDGHTPDDHRSSHRRKVSGPSNNPEEFHTSHNQPRVAPTSGQKKRQTPETNPELFEPVHVKIYAPSSSLLLPQHSEQQSRTVKGRTMPEVPAFSAPVHTTYADPEAVAGAAAPEQSHSNAPRKMISSTPQRETRPNVKSTPRTRRSEPPISNTEPSPLRRSSRLRGMA